MARLYTRKSLGLIIYKLDPTGAPLSVADGEGVIVLPGNADQSTRFGPRTRTIAAIETACLNVPERSIVSGADLTISDCPISDAESTACLFDNWGLEYDAAGLPVCAAPHDPGEDCDDCGKSTEASGALGILQPICVTDCANGNEEIQLNGWRNVPKFTQSTLKQSGGANAGSIVDMTSSPELAGEGWLFGPNDIAELYDENGDPAKSSGFCGCPLDEEACALFAELFSECGGCIEYAGCLITPEMVAAGIAPESPLLTF